MKVNNQNAIQIIPEYKESSVLFTKKSQTLCTSKVEDGLF